MLAVFRDVQCHNLSKVGVAVNENKILEKLKVLFRVFQPFVEVETDYLVRNIVSARL